MGSYKKLILILFLVFVTLGCSWNEQKVKAWEATHDFKETYRVGDRGTFTFNVIVTNTGDIPMYGAAIQSYDLWNSRTDKTNLQIKMNPALEPGETRNFIVKAALFDTDLMDLDDNEAITKWIEMDIYGEAFAAKSVTFERGYDSPNVRAY